MSKHLKISMDGGITWHECGELRIEVPEQEDATASVTMTMTHEGMVTDCWRAAEPQDLLATSSVLWEDLIGDMENGSDV